MAQARSCNDCYFRVHRLCALSRTEPCATFRLSLNGKLVPPQQAPLLPPPLPAAPVATVSG